jgi:hypothetical protein
MYWFRGPGIWMVIPGHSRSFQVSGIRYSCKRRNKEALEGGRWRDAKAKKLDCATKKLPPRLRSLNPVSPEKFTGRGTTETMDRREMGLNSSISCV